MFELVDNGRRQPTEPTNETPMTVRAMIDAYLAWAKSHYRRADGSATGTVGNIRDATRQLLELFGDQPAADFSMLQLTQLRQAMLDSGRLSPRTINDRINRIRAAFVWARDGGLIPPLVPVYLQSLKPLRVPKRPPKQVERELVISTVAAAAERASHHALKISTMIQLQWETGMRPDELCRMRLSRIKRDVPEGEAWIYEPERHKSQHHGLDRPVYLGDESQSLIRSWMLRIRGDYLFEGRTPGQPMRPRSYYQAIRRLNQASGLEHWYPYKIRHAAGYRFRDQDGLDTAQVLMGHANSKTTEIYAPPNHAKAAEAAKRLS